MTELQQPMIKNLEPAIYGNAGTWIATIVTWQSAQAIMAFVATLCSIIVSLATLLWIRKQSKALDNKKHKNHPHQ